MSHTNKIVVHPITNWAIAPAEQSGQVVMRFRFLADPETTNSVSLPTCAYGMTADQARSVAYQILSATSHLDAFGSLPVNTDL